MDRDVQARLSWVRLFKQTGNAGLVCKRCGISRPTLRKWLRRFEAKELEGLKSSANMIQLRRESKNQTIRQNWP